MVGSGLQLRDDAEIGAEERRADFSATSSSRALSLRSFAQRLRSRPTPRGSAVQWTLCRNPCPDYAAWRREEANFCGPGVGRFGIIGSERRHEIDADEKISAQLARFADLFRVLRGFMHLVADDLPGDFIEVGGESAAQLLKFWP